MKPKSVPVHESGTSSVRLCLAGHRSGWVISLELCRSRNSRLTTLLKQEIERFFQQLLDRTIFLKSQTAQLLGDRRIEITADMFAAIA